MGRPQVSIRLGTTGRGDVEKDFAAIGDASDAQAKRYQAGWERASAEVDRALEKQAKAAARMAAATPAASGATNMVNPITGGSYAQADGRAQASAAAIAGSYDQAEASARRLLASVDPLYAAQLRYDSALQEAIGLQKIGAMSTDQLAVVQTGLKRQLDDTTLLYGKQGTAVGNTRIAQMELMHVVRGSVDQFAAGAAPMQIFTMHLGMLGQAAALSGESMGKFGAFMASGWGLALTVAVVALAPLIAKLFQTGETVDSLVEKLKKEAAQQALNDQAHKAFGMTLDGVTISLKKNREALDNIIDGEKSAAEKALAGALAQKARLDLINKTTQGLINQARAQLELNNSLAIGPETKGHVDPHMVAAGEAAARLDALQATLPQLTANIAEAQSQIDAATAAVYAQAAGKDTVELIKDRYKTLVEQATKRAIQESAAAKAAGDQARAQALITTELQKQVHTLDAKRDAEVKAAEEREKKPGKDAGGEAIFDAQIASFFDTAAKYRGRSEHNAADRGVLEAFFKEANQQLDPEKVKWCAAFVNAVLAANGVKGTGSLAASSFLTFGKDDTKSPQRGDIAVVKSGAGQHVGFVDTVDKSGNVRMLAGNTGDKVAEATYSKNQVLAIRRPPTPSESATAADKAVSEALQAQQTFDSESQRLNQQYLQALGKVVAGYDAQASVQLLRAQGEHDSEAKEIAANLAAGKYGDATSDLAQKRAQQLQSANDQVLGERKAAIALESYEKALQSQDAAAERDAKFKTDALAYQQSIAHTAGERRKLGQEIIDIEYKEKEQHLKYLLALDQLLGNTEDAAKVAAELAHLPAEKKRAEDQNNRQNQSPFEAYRDELNNLDAGESTQSSIVNGLKSFNDGLTEALMKSKNLKELWHNFGSLVHDVAQQILKDLINLAIKMFILKPIMNLIAGGAGGGGGFATGTEYFSGGMAWVGEHGPEMVRLPRGSKIHTAADSRRLAAANDAGPTIGSITINGDFRGADPAAVASINQKLDQMQEELPGQVVTIMTDAKTRFVWRG